MLLIWEVAMIAIVNGYILTMAEHNFERGFLLLGDDGTLLEIGETVSIPEGTRGIDAPVTPLRWLPLCAGLSVAEGHSWEEDWNAITINPAKQMKFL